MNKTKAYAAIQAGYRLTHRAFTTEEFLELSGAQVVDQSGGFFGAQWADEDSNPMWAEDWEFWVSPDETPPQVQTGILVSLLRKIMGPNHTSPAVMLSDDCYRPLKVLRMERMHLEPGTDFHFNLTPADVLNHLTGLLVQLGASYKVAEHLGKFFIDYMCYQQKGTVALEPTLEPKLCFLFGGYYVRLSAGE